jgi:hypothetical protein
MDISFFSFCLWCYRVVGCRVVALSKQLVDIYTHTHVLDSFLVAVIMMTNFTTFRITSSTCSGNHFYEDFDFAIGSRGFSF